MMRPNLSMLTSALLLFAVCACDTTVLGQGYDPPGRQVVLTYTGATPDPQHVGSMRCSPAAVTAWSDANGNGSWDVTANWAEQPTEWTPKQRLWVDGTEYVLQWSGRTWYWTHPDDVGLQPWYTYRTVGWPHAWIGEYTPNGRRFGAMTVRVQPGAYGWLDMIPHIGSVLGGGTTTRYYDGGPAYSFGGCTLSRQPLDAPGNLFGHIGSVPAFYGYIDADLASGVFYFGFDYSTAAMLRSGDANRDLLFTAQDVFDFLSDYCGGDMRADLDGSGDLGAGDIFDFLEAWFQG